MDQPSGDGSNTYLISRASAAEGIKVVLSGCGADELHGGYPHFHSLSRLYTLLNGFYPLLSKFPSPIAQLLGWQKDALYRERLQGLLQQVNSPQGMVQETRRYFTPRQIQSLYPPSQDCRSLELPTDQAEGPPLEIKTQISLAEISGYLKNTLLRDSDWATMANHQELRVPYLGKHYIETVIQTPWAVKHLHKQSKYLIASQIPDRLQPILKRPKTGFSIDYALYLKTSLRDVWHTAMQYLNEAHGFRLDLDQIDQHLKAGDLAKQARRYWALTSLGVYLYHHR
jgi:asparagine synthase (glutamine-hydrolysing)